MKRTILECTVGSRLHGTATEESDHDVREIAVSNAYDFFDPFHEPTKIESRTSTTTGGPIKVDTVTYELKHFLYQLRRGNPTFVEVMTSPEIAVATKTGRLLRDQWRDFIDPEQFRRNHIGYLRDILKQAETRTDQIRVGKQLSAGCIAANRAIVILKDKDATDYTWISRAQHLALKAGEAKIAMTAKLVIAMSITAIAELEWAHPERTRDEQWIARFCYNVYHDRIDR